MPALKNPRHERFARAYLQTGVAYRAYHAAGYRSRMPRQRDKNAPAFANASRLIRSDKIKQRLQELAAMAARRHEVTIDSLVEELDLARNMAWHLRQPAAVTQAVMAKARVTGNIIERKESGAPGDFAQLATAADVIARARIELGDDVADMLAQMVADDDGAESMGSTDDDGAPATDRPRPSRKRKPSQALPRLLLAAPNKAE